MHKLTKFLLLISLWAGFTQSAFALETSDLTDINQIMVDWSNCWNNQGGVGFVDLYADDADFINPFGTHFSGNDEIEARHIDILNTFMNGTIFNIVDYKVRELQPGAAIVQLSWSLDGFYRPGQDVMIPLKGIFTHVLSFGDEGWKIASSQNTISRHQL